MSVSRDLFDLRTGGLYLPSLLLIVIQPEIPGLYLIAWGGILAAVFFHGMMRAVFGIGGPEENPMERGDAIQGIQVAISGKGPHDEMPDSFPQMMAAILWNPMRYGIRPIVLAVIGLISLIAWLPAVLLSLGYGVLQFQQFSVAVQLLIFAEIVWVLQWAVWRFFIPSYYLEESNFR